MAARMQWKSGQEIATSAIWKVVVRACQTRAPILISRVCRAHQRPGGNLLGQARALQEHGVVVGERMELHADLVLRHGPARQARPLHRHLAFIDVLLGRALVVEAEDLLGLRGQVGDQEADPREQLARMLLHLGQHPGAACSSRLVAHSASSR